MQLGTASRRMINELEQRVHDPEKTKADLKATKIVLPVCVGGPWPLQTWSFTCRINGDTQGSF